jgi:hypothetical protein
MSHKFKVRQQVRLSRPGYSDARSSGGSVYEVVRLLPADQLTVSAQSWKRRLRPRSGLAARGYLVVAASCLITASLPFT